MPSRRLRKQPDESGGTTMPKRKSTGLLNRREAVAT
jgi:hypothetical protein